MSTSVALATVAAVLAYGVGRVMRSPLRRWRSRASSQQRTIGAPSSRDDRLDAPVRLRRF
jgi:hypothetical protein